MSADKDFAALIDRILRCREAEDAAKEDTKEVYAELKAKGYDKTVAGALVGELRKMDKNADKFAERNAMLDLYRDAYERAKGSHTHTYAYARESVDPMLVETIAKGVQTEIGRKTLVTALDIMIEREEQDETNSPGTATKFQAKASEDNGATGTAIRVPSDSMTGEVSRVDAGRTASATSERMDVTAGETATNSHSLPASSLVADKADGVTPPALSASHSDDVPRFLTRRSHAEYRPNCQHPDVSAASGLDHCYSCRKAMSA